MRSKGPWMKPLGLSMPIRMGRPYEIYRPIVAIEVAAEKATELPTDGMARRKANNAASQTVRMGEWNLSST